MRRIAVCSEKGGTGKSTSAINLAVALARAGRRVLLVDLDPQANASLVLTGGEKAAPPTAADVLLGGAGVAEAMRPTATPGLSLLPAAVDLAEANLALAGAIGREARLRSALGRLAAYHNDPARVYGLNCDSGQNSVHNPVHDNVNDIDVVVIDTPPTRSILTINALVAADDVLIPVEPTLFSLAGLGGLQAAIEDVRRYLGNGGLRVGGVLLCRTRHDNVSRDVEGQLRGAFGGLVFKTTVPASIKVEEAHGRFMSVIDYAPRSPGARAYLALAEEVLSDGDERTQGRVGAGPVGPVPADLAG
jgi:chromosome partitioning protein